MSTAKNDEEGVFICWNANVKRFVITICHNKDYSGCNLNAMKQNCDYFYSFPLSNDDLIFHGSIVHESTTKIPTCANDIKLLEGITQCIGHYEIGKDFHNLKYLKSYEIIHHLLLIIYDEYKQNQNPILQESEGKESHNLPADQSNGVEKEKLTTKIKALEKEIALKDKHLTTKITELEKKIALKDKRLNVKYKQLRKLHAAYNVCSMQYSDHNKHFCNHNVIYLWCICLYFTH